MAKRRDKGAEKRVARARVTTLLDQGQGAIHGPDSDLADRYGVLALKVARRFQLKLSPLDKARVCRKCGAIRNSTSTRVRLTGARITTTCLRCNHVHRRPLESA